MSIREIAWKMQQGKLARPISARVFANRIMHVRNVHIAAVDTQTWLRNLVEQGGVSGVETADGPLRCAGDVIVCCGAFVSPALLLRSGMGPARHLQALGIDVAHDLPGVGEHLLDHPEGVIIWERTSATSPIPQATIRG